MAEQPTQTQPTSSEKPKSDPLQKALADAEFWRTSFEKQELETKAVKLHEAKLQQAHAEQIAKVNANLAVKIDAEKALMGALSKAKTDIEFWISGVEQKQARIKELEAVLAEKLESEKRSEALLAELEDTRGDIVAAKSLLQELADHTAGRDGNYAKSRIFCSSCENSYSCPISKVYRFIDPPTKERGVA